MALINCPECDEKVSSKATICPKCGYDISKYMKKSWITKNKRKISCWLLILICVVVLVIGCLYGIRLVLDKRAEKDKNVYTEMTITYDDLIAIVEMIKADKEEIENDEALVTQHVDTMYSYINKIDGMLDFEAPENVKRKFVGYIYSSPDEIYSWEDYKEKILKGECFWNDDKTDTIKKIIDNKRSLAAENFDDVSVGMSRVEALWLLGTDYRRYSKEQEFIWDNKYIVVFKDDFVIEKRIEE